MTVDTPEAPAPPAAPTPFACPHCRAPIADDQEWCVECGAAARTVIARTPRWRLPIALIAVIATLSLIALAIAFVALADHDNDTGSTQQTTTTTPDPSA